MKRDECECGGDKKAVKVNFFFAPPLPDIDVDDEEIEPVRTGDTEDAKTEGEVEEETEAETEDVEAEEEVEEETGDERNGDTEDVETDEEREGEK